MTDSKENALSLGWKILAGVAAAVICGFAVLGVTSLSQQSVAPKPKPVPLPEVKIIALQSERQPRMVERFARLAPVRQWEIATEVSGRVTERPIENGCRVDKGGLLISLDAAPFEAAVQSSVALAKETEVQVRLAKANLQRVQRLVQRKAASAENLEQAQARYDQALANQQAANADVDAKTYQRDHSKLFAPADGLVSALTVEVGEYVAAGQTLGLYSEVDALLVKVLVPWDVRRGVKLGNKATIIDGKERESSAILVRAAQVQSGESGQFELEFELENQKQQLFAGEPVRCRFTTGEALPRIRVPRESLFKQYGQWRALVPAEDKGDGRWKVASVPVKTGDGDPIEGWVDVVWGLRDGDKIVIPGRVAAVRDEQVVAEGPVANVWLPPYALPTQKTSRAPNISGEPGT